VAYVTAEARQEMLQEIARAIDELGTALALLGDAYERLDERTADVLEEQLFRPAQAAYGRAKRTHAAFAERHGLTGRQFQPGTPGAASSSVAELLEGALEAAAEADVILGDLQDSMRPVEVGDPELRAGLAEVRTLLGELPARGRQLQRVLGR
jgi:hypothetical protein